MFLAAFVWVCLTACGGSPPARDELSEPQGVEATPAGWLGGIAITYDDVGRYLRLRDPHAFAVNLEGVYMAYIVRAEAKRLGVTVPNVALTRATTEKYREWARNLKVAAEKGGRTVEPAEWLERVAGLDVASFRAYLRRHAEVELLQDRLLRYEVATQPRVEASIITVMGADAAAKIRSQLDGGADFGEIAKQQSLHASAPNGGRIPFALLREDLNDFAVASALFTEKAESVVGPFATGKGADGVQQIYFIHGRETGRIAPYAELEESIADGLGDRPVDVPEYERWRRRVLLTHRFQAAPPPR